MTDFTAKMHKIRFRLGLPRLGELTAYRPPVRSWIWGPLRGRGRAELGKRRETGSGGEGKGGPTSYC